MFFKGSLKSPYFKKRFPFSPQIVLSSGYYLRILDFSISFEQPSSNLLNSLLF